MREKLIEQIRKTRMIAIVRGIPAERLPALAAALLAGGINCMELPFTDEPAEKTAALLQNLRACCGTEMFLGAGTVTDERRVRLAYDAGAQFIVSPDTFAPVILKTRELGMVSIPGAMTPTEILTAHRCGADFVKVFPADVLGPAYLQTLAMPLQGVRLLAFGGINAANIGAYLRSGAAGAGVGSFLTGGAAAAKPNWEKITNNVKTLRRICQISY